MLFVGPPGLGKTTLAQIVARELGVNFRATAGPVIAKAGDLAALLTNLEERDVLFIDEIHRLNPAIEEVLYPAMEDFQLDLIIGTGPAARSVKIDLAKFTLVGATTRAGLLTNPLRDRFGIPVRLNFYSESELEQIVNRGARVLGIGVTADGANEIARRARGTPRVAGRLLRRVRDFASVAGAAAIDRAVADKALAALEVDGAGLDAMDRRYLTTIALNYGGGPVGVETLAAALSEPRDAIEDIIEPYLIQCGLLQRTPRGRLITGHAFRHLGLPEPARDPAQFGLFASRGMTELRGHGGSLQDRAALKDLANTCTSTAVLPVAVGDDDLDFQHDFVFGVAAVPAFACRRKPSISGERARPRGSSNQTIFGSAACDSGSSGCSAICFGLFQRQRGFAAKPGATRSGTRSATGLRTFAALVDVTGFDQAGDRLRAFPDRIATRIEARLAFDVREFARRAPRIFWIEPQRIAHIAQRPGLRASARTSAQESQLHDRPNAIGS